MIQNLQDPSNLFLNIPLRYMQVKKFKKGVGINLVLLQKVRKQQSWGRYFEKVTSYILLVTFRRSNSLHITDYFHEKVTRYSYKIFTTKFVRYCTLVLKVTIVIYY